MTEINAQEYLEKNWNDKSIKAITQGNFQIDKKLKGDLTISDYPDLEEINLSNEELTSLSISNCPNLKSLNVRHNQLTKLELETPNLEEIIAGKNELSTLDLANCQKIKKLIIPDNPDLNKVIGLNLSSLINVNITDTSLNLAEDYQELKISKEAALEKIKALKEAAETKEFKLAEPIQTPEQAELAILNHLKKTGEKWLSHLQNGDSPLLETRLNSAKRKEHFKQTLALIQNTQTSKDYQALATHWSGINDYQELVQKWKNEEDYGLDYDGSLDKLLKFMQYL